METKTHWRKMVNTDYLGAYSLQPKEERTLTIAKVLRTEVQGNGGKKQECTVLHFVEKEKPMIVNRINSKVITKIYGTPFIEDWAGKKIIIYARWVDAFGEQLKALRIKPEIPTFPELKKKSKAYANALQHIKNGGKMEDIEKRFVITEKIKKQLYADAI